MKIGKLWLVKKKSACMAQASRVLNQCNQLNLLTKKDIQLIMQISAISAIC